MKSSSNSKFRVIVDECVSPSSPLIARFRQTLVPGQPVEWSFLSEDHPAIPDTEILHHLLGPGTILLTQDRVLHNQACDLRFRSYILDEQGNLRRRKLPEIRAPKVLPAIGTGELNPDYRHPANPIATALKITLAERDFKRYQTRRRRIRSYFGSEGQIASVALTIGTRDMGSNIVCGFFLTLAGNSGVKGIRASEGYALINRGVWEPSWCLIHGLRELFLLQLENVAAELFIVPSDAFTLCQRLMPETSSFPASKSNQALRILLGGILQIRALPCLKGRFFDAMKHKLDQLARSRSNELVPLNFGPVIAAVCQAGVEVRPC